MRLNLKCNKKTQRRGWALGERSRENPLWEARVELEAGRYAPCDELKRSDPRLGMQNIPQSMGLGERKS